MIQKGKRKKEKGLGLGIGKIGLNKVKVYKLQGGNLPNLRK
jgi:hypothetical protein